MDQEEIVGHKALLDLVVSYLVQHRIPVVIMGGFLIMITFLIPPEGLSIMSQTSLIVGLALFSVKAFDVNPLLNWLELTWENRNKENSDEQQEQERPGLSAVATEPTGSDSAEKNQGASSS